MNNKSLIALIIIILVSVGSYFYFHWSQQPKRHPYDFAGPCPGKTLTKKMQDVYLRGILEKDEEYQLIQDWYWCNEVKRGEVILFKYSDQQPPVVRKVYGVPGDKFEVIFDEDMNAWKVKIAGKIHMHGDKPFTFGGEEKPVLKLLEESRNGVLGPREIIIFASFPPGETDSSILGVVNLNDVVGKVVLKSDTQTAEQTTDQGAKPDAKSGTTPDAAPEEAPATKSSPAAAIPKAPPAKEKASATTSKHPATH